MRRFPFTAGSGFFPCWGAFFVLFGPRACVNPPRACVNRPFCACVHDLARVKNVQISLGNVVSERSHACVRVCLCERGGVCACVCVSAQVCVRVFVCARTALERIEFWMLFACRSKSGPRAAKSGQERPKSGPRAAQERP